MATLNSVGNALHGITGSGSFVGNTSPTLVTPQLGAATATSINFGGSTLSSYATGTWTPTLSPISGTFTTLTYTTNTGEYSQFGNLVIFTGVVQVNTFTIGSGSGALLMSLPVTGVENYPVTFIPCLVKGTVTTYTGPLFFDLINASPNGQFVNQPSTATTNTLQASDLQANAIFRVSGVYYVT